MNTYLNDLTHKFHGYAPRYTNYPIPEHWSRTPHFNDFESKLRLTRRKQRPVALYLQIPFSHKYACSRDCCSLVQAKGQASVKMYIAQLEREMETFAEMAGGPILANKLHLAGISPAFLTHGDMERLMSSLRQYFNFSSCMDCTFEADPEHCSHVQIRHFYDLGFNRAIFHVHDFDQVVLAGLQREESFEQVQHLVEYGNQLGYRSIKLNFHYGLPRQTVDSMLLTVDKINQIRPGRISFFKFDPLSRAHGSTCPIPLDWVPGPEERAAIYLAISRKLQEAQYIPIGRNLFVFPGDELAFGKKHGMLRSNFMGYCTRKSQAILGLGVSSTSFLENQYFQNTTCSNSYQNLVDEGLPPIGCSYELSHTDIRCKFLVDDLMCNLRIDPITYRKEFGEDMEFTLPGIHACLDTFVLDGLLTLVEGVYKVTDMGRLFVRHMGTYLDHDWPSKAKKAVESHSTPSSNFVHEPVKI